MCLIPGHVIQSRVRHGMHTMESAQSKEIETVTVCVDNFWMMHTRGAPLRFVGMLNLKLMKERG